MAIANPIDVRFYPPPADLKRYFTTFYFTRFTLPDGGFIEDALHPEWGGLRMFDRPAVDAWIADSGTIGGTRFIATGPTVRCIDFRIRSCDFWGVGLLPLGWTQFVREPADAHANLIADGTMHPSFSKFTPLLDQLFAPGLSEAAQLDRFIAFFRSRLGEPATDQKRIQAIHAALVDPEINSVGRLVEQIGASQRTVERICHRAFGFAPKLLLRRQRFMRSIARFMLDPSLKWIGAIDSLYHDQAQFVRDFHYFMGMSPREYTTLPHEILLTFMRERIQVAGAAVQAMDPPTGVRLPDDESEGRAA